VIYCFWTLCEGVLHRFPLLSHHGCSHVYLSLPPLLFPHNSIAIIDANPQKLESAKEKTVVIPLYAAVCIVVFAVFVLGVSLGLAYRSNLLTQDTKELGVAIAKLNVINEDTQSEAVSSRSTSALGMSTPPQSDSSSSVVIIPRRRRRHRPPSERGVVPIRYFGGSDDDNDPPHDHLPVMLKCIPSSPHRANSHHPLQLDDGRDSGGTSA
jgi:hypothetical protein